jgi:hypothetical protein
MRFILVLPSGGCFLALSPEQMTDFKARSDAAADATCRSDGARPGTYLYPMPDAGPAIARFGRVRSTSSLLSAPDNPMVQSDAPTLRNNLPQQTRCQTMRVGAALQTVCN